MKKLLLTLILSINVLNAESYFQVGSNNQKFQNESTTGFNVGYGFTNSTDKNIFLGVGFNFGYAKLYEKPLTSFSGDFKVGYTYKDLSLYTLGSALQQSYIVNGYGFGVGGGLEYRLSDEIAAIAEYRSYDMTNEYDDYDYSQTIVSLRYSF